AIGLPGDEQNEHLVAVLARPQFATQVDAALSWQHPVQNKEREGFRGHSALGLLSGSDLCHFVAAHCDQPGKGFPAVVLVFDKKNVHHAIIGVSRASRRSLISPSNIDAPKTAD